MLEVNTKFARKYMDRIAVFLLWNSTLNLTVQKGITHDSSEVPIIGHFDTKNTVK